jgi:hypothetical protein
MHATACMHAHARPHTAMYANTHARTHARTHTHTHTPTRTHTARSGRPCAQQCDVRAAHRQTALVWFGTVTVLGRLRWFCCGLPQEAGNRSLTHRYAMHSSPAGRVRGSSVRLPAKGFSPITVAPPGPVDRFLLMDGLISCRLSVGHCWPQRCDGRWAAVQALLSLARPHYCGNCTSS